MQKSCRKNKQGSNRSGQEKQEKVRELENLSKISGNFLYTNASKSVNERI